MCRLAYIPAKAKVGRKGLHNFFTQLEKSFGGDGNGYAAISPDGTSVINKGVKFDCGAIAKDAITLNRQGWAIYFHTRKISIGWSSDEQCHPFKIDGPEFQGVLCHNGTWSEGGTLAKYLQTGSDTATFAYLIGQLGLEELEKRKLMPKSGVFMLYGGKSNETKTHKVLHLGGSLEYCPATGIWASEFFKDWPRYHETIYVAEGAHMLNKPAPEEKVTKVTTHYAGYSKKDIRDKYTLSDYWKDRGYVDATEEVVDEAIETDDDVRSRWGSRYFYHN